jgi:hypothetical protein
MAIKGEVLKEIRYLPPVLFPDYTSEWLEGFCFRRLPIQEWIPFVRHSEHGGRDDPRLDLRDPKVWNFKLG